MASGCASPAAFFPRYDETHSWQKEAAPVGVEVQLLGAIVRPLLKDMTSRQPHIRAEALAFAHEGEGLAYLGELVGVDGEVLRATVLKRAVLP